MKNIHIIPTDKPSRLGYLTKKGKEVYKDLRLFDRLMPNILDSENQNIYITNNEEIKDNDWCLFGIDALKPIKVRGIKHKQIYLADCKKIILTTDADLINDGIQPIPDDFLEWFVKNPNCESVEVQKWFDGVDFLEYKIIIPKEESKQETPEEAAELNAKKVGSYAGYQDFIAGAKWQQERMYSEEEVKGIVDETIEKFYKHFYTLTKAEMKEKWFEKFKKK